MFTATAGGLGKNWQTVGLSRPPHASAILPASFRPRTIGVVSQRPSEPRHRQQEQVAMWNYPRQHLEHGHRIEKSVAAANCFELQKAKDDNSFSRSLDAVKDALPSSLKNGQS